MILFIIAGTVLAGLLGWGAWESKISRDESNVEKQRRNAERVDRTEREAAEYRGRIVRNPLNAILPFLWQNGPARVRKSQAVKVATIERDRVKGSVDTVISGFKGGVEPSVRQRNLLMALTLWWIVAFAAQAGLDFPVFRALTGGSAWAAAFLTVAIAAAMAGAPLLYDYVRLSRQTEHGSDRSTRGTLVMVICVSLLILGILVWLAPRRADAMYDDQIATKKAQIIAAQAPGVDDKTGASAFKNQLNQLEDNKKFAGEAFQAITVAAAASEFGAGLAVMGGLQVLQLGAARRRLTKAEKSLVSAKNEDEIFTATSADQMARRMTEAGVEPVAANAAMQQHARSAAPTPAATPVPPTVPAQAPAPAAESAPETPAAAPTPGPTATTPAPPTAGPIPTIPIRPVSRPAAEPTSPLHFNEI